MSCVIGDYCRDHGFVHGAEAEELRRAIELLAKEADATDDDHVDGRALRELLDDVDARDSLAYREAMARKEGA